MPLPEHFDAHLKTVSVKPQTQSKSISLACAVRWLLTGCLPGLFVRMRFLGR